MDESSEGGGRERGRRAQREVREKGGGELRGRREGERGREREGKGVREGERE
jgi:hypothetical protein